MHQIQRKISTRLFNFISRFTLIKVISFYIWFAYSQPSQSKCDKNRALQEFQILRVLKLLSQNKNKKLTQKRKHMTVLEGGVCPTSEVPDDPVPVVEALAAGFTVGEFPRGASVAPVTLVAADPCQTNTLTRPSVTLHVVGTLGITVTGCGEKKKQKGRGSVSGGENQYCNI